MTIENLYFVHGHGQNWCFMVKFRGKIFGRPNLDFGRGHGRNLDYLTMVKAEILAMVMVKIFDH